MKKILSVLLVVLFCIGLCPVSTLAANEDIIASIKGGVAQIGGTITVPVFLDVNKGFVTLGIKVSYDADILEIVCEDHEEGGKSCSPSVEKVRFANGNQGFNSQFHTNNPYRFQWAYGTITKDILQTGQIASITFKVKNTAKLGETKVAVEIDQASCYTKKPRTFTGGEATIKLVCENHISNEGKVTKNPTCTEKGVKTYLCNICNEVAKTEDIKALGHSFGEWTKTKDPTCTAQGEETRVCRNDTTHKETREIKALGHSFGEWTKTKAPTCTVAGEETRICRNDATHKETREIKALGHNFGQWTKTKAPTCTEAGEETRVCRNDATHKETREIKALGHNFGEWTKTKAPTCTEEGEETRICSNDANHKETRKSEKASHTVVWKITKEPTIKEEGERTGTCSVCGNSVTQTVPKLTTTIGGDNLEFVPDVDTNNESSNAGTNNESNADTNNNSNVSTNNKEEEKFEEDFKVDSSEEETFSGYIKGEIKETFPKKENPIMVGNKTVAAIYDIILSDTDNGKILPADKVVVLTIPVREFIRSTYKNIVLAGVDANGKYVVIKGAKLSNNKFVVSGKYGSLSKLLIAGDKIAVEEDIPANTDEENQSTADAESNAESVLDSQQNNTSSEEQSTEPEQEKENTENPPVKKKNTTVWAIAVVGFLAVAFALVFLSMRKRF